MSETIGQKLRRSREEKHLSLEQVSAATRIRPHYIEALERDDLSAIPSAAQARGFLRLYADFLGLNADDLVPVTRAPQAAASLPDVPAAPVQETVSTPAPAKPNLLANLRERFARRPQTDNIIPSSSVVEESIAAPEPEPFVPARYSEELPAAPQPVFVEETKKEEPTKPVKRSSARKPAAKKPAPKKEKAPTKTKVGKKSAVKKKIVNSLSKKKANRTKRG